MYSPIRSTPEEVLQHFTAKGPSESVRNLEDLLNDERFDEISLVLKEYSRRLACWFDLYKHHPKLASESFRRSDISAALQVFGLSVSGPLTPVQQPRVQGLQRAAAACVRFLREPSVQPLLDAVAVCAAGFASWGPLLVLIGFAEQLPVQYGKLVLEDPCAPKNYTVIQHWPEVLHESMALSDKDDSACVVASFFKHDWKAHLVMPIAMSLVALGWLLMRGFLICLSTFVISPGTLFELKQSSVVKVYDKLTQRDLPTVFGWKESVVVFLYASVSLSFVLIAIKSRSPGTFAVAATVGSIFLTVAEVALGKSQKLIEQWNKDVILKAKSFADDCGKCSSQKAINNVKELLAHNPGNSQFALLNSSTLKCIMPLLPDFIGEVPIHIRKVAFPSYDDSELISIDVFESPDASQVMRIFKYPTLKLHGRALVKGAFARLKGGQDFTNSFGRFHDHPIGWQEWKEVVAGGKGMIVDIFFSERAVRMQFPTDVLPEDSPERQQYPTGFAIDFPCEALDCIVEGDSSSGKCSSVVEP